MVLPYTIDVPDERLAAIRAKVAANGRMPWSSPLADLRAFVSTVSGEQH